MARLDENSGPKGRCLIVFAQVLAGLLGSVRRNVRFGGFLRVMLGMKVVSMRSVGVMRSLLVVAGLMMLGGFFVVTRRMLMMLSGLMVVTCGFLGHSSLLFPKKLTLLLRPEKHIEGNVDFWFRSLQFLENSARSHQVEAALAGTSAHSRRR
jgi:hypothetical protein